MLAAIDAARAEGDSLGGVTEVRATGVPIGLGSHVQWDRRLTGLLAQAVMSIPSVKGVETGEGFAGARMRGSESQDVILPADEWDGRPWRRASNHAGGLEGGMTNGEPLVVRAALKPISTLARPLPSADLATGESVEAHYERSDVCIVPVAGVIAEAMVAIVLAARDAREVRRRPHERDAAQLSRLPRDRRAAPVELMHASEPPRRIFLTGFSFSGKSRVAPLVAATLGWRAIDLDDLIEEAAGKPVPADLRRRRRARLSRCARRRRCDAPAARPRSSSRPAAASVLAEENRRLMAESGVVVCLEARPETIFARLQQPDDGERIGAAAAARRRPAGTHPPPEGAAPAALRSRGFHRPHRRPGAGARGGRGRAGLAPLRRMPLL